MNIQHSFKEKRNTLFLVPTPIGNFDDMTFRAVAVLQEVDVIFSEDTRVTKVLLSHFNISTPLMSYHSFNEEIQAEEILKLLRQNKNVAIVSDAGMPCISDPGFYIARKAINENFNVISLPGANAALMALVGSGLPTNHFYFHGFLSSRKTQRKKELEDLCDRKETIIFYEAARRIKETLEDMLDTFGNRQIVIARELTKKHEEYMRTTLKAFQRLDQVFRGEIVIVVEGSEFSQTQRELRKLSIFEHYEYYIKKGYESKEAMKKVAEDRRISKSIVYKEVIRT